MKKYDTQSIELMFKDKTCGQANVNRLHTVIHHRIHHQSSYSIIKAVYGSYTSQLSDVEISGP